jgi:hypothetical protein
LTKLTIKWVVIVITEKTVTAEISRTEVDRITNEVKRIAV